MGILATDDNAAQMAPVGLCTRPVRVALEVGFPLLKQQLQ